MVENLKEQEHFFIKRAKEDNLLDTVVRRWLHYSAEQLTLPPEYNFNNLESPEQKTGIDVLEYTVPLAENSFVTRAVEYIPHNLIERNPNSLLPNETLVIIGGGTSPGPGTNVSLALRTERALIDQVNQGKPVPNIKKMIVLSHPSGSAFSSPEIIPANTFKETSRFAQKVLEAIKVDLKKMCILGYSNGGALAVQLAARIDSPIDLYLVDPTGLVNHPLKELGFHFSIGDYLGSMKRFSRKKVPFWKRPYLSAENWIKAWADYDGNPSVFKIIRDIFQPQKRTRPFSKAYGISDPYIPGPNFQEAHTFTIENVQNKIMGSVTLFPLQGSNTVGPVKASFWTQHLFPHARLRSTYPIPDAESHSSFITDPEGVKTVAKAMSNNILALQATNRKNK